MDQAELGINKTEFVFWFPLLSGVVWNSVHGLNYIYISIYIEITLKLTNDYD